MEMGVELCFLHTCGRVFQGGSGSFHGEWHVGSPDVSLEPWLHRPSALFTNLALARATDLSVDLMMPRPYLLQIHSCSERARERERERERERAREGERGREGASERRV